MPSARLLAAARTLLGLSQDEFAQLVGINPSVLKRLEAGKTSPRLATVERITRVFREHGIEFLSETDERVEGLVHQKRISARRKARSRARP